MYVNIVNKCLIEAKMSGSESQGQEEAAYACERMPTQPLH